MLLQELPFGKAFGEDWTYEIYFDPDADKIKAGINSISSAELMTELIRVVGVNEDIKTVSLYKCPLIKWKWTIIFFYHKFVIFETKDWFWSIEKDTKAIIIQRSKKISDVKDKKIKQEKRLRNVVLMKSTRGQTSVHDLIKWLCDEHELYKKYKYRTANCQRFANAVFDKVAMSWCYAIKFRPDANKDFLYFKDNELKATLANFVGQKENIQKVFLYRSEIKDSTTANPKWICILKINDWWWSIENLKEIMIITRNRKESQVKEYIRYQSRIKMTNSANGTKNVVELIDWLYNKKELKKLHSYIILSTEKFAKDVFVYVSGNKLQENDMTDSPTKSQSKQQKRQRRENRMANDNEHLSDNKQVSHTPSMPVDDMIDLHKDGLKRNDDTNN